MKQQVVVRTREELKEAIDKKIDQIIVKGELAEKVNTSLKVRQLSKTTLVLLGTLLAGVPFTGGLSRFLIAPLTGTDIALIIAVLSLGLALVLALGKDYKKVSFHGKGGNNEATLVLERNQRD